MDVTFTNVLEGARQYFQGLPTAPNSAAGPAYSNPSANESEQNPEVPSSAAAYWPPPQEASRPPTREQTPIQRPPSHHSDTSRPSSHAQMANHYTYQEQNQQFQFPRPQSREAPSNQYHQQQYQNTVTTPTTSQYHQLQNVGYYQQQQQKTYYQMQAKINSNNNAYKVASSSQAQNTQENAYYKHLYTPHAQTTNQMQYKQENKQEMNTSYRATHNLPPIASLSLISYHSNRTRDVVRTSNPKAKTMPTNTLINQMIPKPISASQQRYQDGSGAAGGGGGVQIDYRNTTHYPNQNRLPMNQNYQYSTTTTQNYTQVIMTTSNSMNYATMPTQSSSQYYQQQQQLQQQQQQQQQQQTKPNQNGRIAPVIKQKRESPLDLSVKTVRTPADSTLDDEDRKFYANRNSTHNYPTYDVYANSFQRNMNRQMPASAPKVDLHPNFNVAATLNQNMYRRELPKTTTNQRPGSYNATTRYPTVSIPTAAHINSYIQSAPQKRENLPRVEFPPQKTTMGMYQAAPEQKKRPADPAPSVIPNKISKVDTWKQRLDQEIEQRFNSYHQQQAKNKAMVNGNYQSGAQTPAQDTRQKEMYPYQQNRQYQQYPQYHNQTYVPSASAHQYPGYQYPSQPQQAMYNVPRSTNATQSSVPPSKPNNLGGANKRVLSLLRNSLEIKGAKEAQKKLEEQMNRYDGVSHKSRLDVQHPSTDVTAPLQPKPGFINRHNVSPFTPTNLPDNNNSLMYKLHIPKAIDSVNFESESSKFDDSQAFINSNNPNGDLDGLAALVAARIRTKAELKQVSEKVEGVANPPKLNKERHSFPPRRRLFSRTEEDGCSNVPPRDKTGLRSSSETSVFDFPDSDSETEMPVLERQTLEDMRRDRRSSTKPTEIKVESPRSVSPDDAFAQACDSFVEQLKNGSGKKRGRRKKIEADVLAKLESVTKEKPLDEVKKEKEDDEDSDVPLINCKNKVEETNEETDVSKKTEVRCEEREVTKRQLSVSLTDLSELKLKEEKNLREIPVLPRPAKKPTFGDGSHFYPGWEEEVYRYKKSLRMPPSLIHVTRPPQYHRLSTSLPDLDPYPQSPSEDTTKTKQTIKSENLDSDNESNHSFNLFHKHNYDSEGSCSIKSLPNTTKEGSILDRLLERYGGRKKRKHKRKEEPKVTPKNDKLELLPTPGKEKTEFRKKTIENFKEVFLKKSNEVHTRKMLKQRVTIKEVFGEDRPASAPPVTCVDIKIKEEPDDDISLSALIKKEEDNNEYADTRQVLKNKLLSRGRKENLLKTLVDKKIKSELLEDEQEEDDGQDSKSETPSIDGDEGNLSGKKQRNKFRNIRRKFSSGFDYIRKKKKQKKDQENDGVKTKKGGKFTSKSNPGSVQDIQKEIKGWVLNKGIGETILHRAARLGYTDITAYCLEKMECSPSPKDNAGYTPLHEASTKGNLAIAKMLLMYGANVSESARGGIRPLHEAVENGYVEIVRLLLSYGADPMLATYSGMTPLSLCSDEATTKLLQNHINDIEGTPGSPWSFSGPASCFDLKETGFDVLEEEPAPDPISDEEDLEFEVSDSILPNLYTLRGEPQSDRWVLLQDLSSMLKIKSRDALLRQICPSTTSSCHVNHKSVLRELKMSDFLEQAHCCQFLNIGEKINTRASKIALVKYTDKVRELLNVEKVTISVR